MNRRIQDAQPSMPKYEDGFKDGYKAGLLKAKEIILNGSYNPIHASIAQTIQKEIENEDKSYQ